MTKDLTLSDLRQSLRNHASRIAEDPQTNSVLSVAQELFFQLENNALSLDNLTKLTTELHGDMAVQRALRFRERHGGDDLSANWDAMTAQLEAAASKGFDAFKALVEKPVGGIVFTGHPTYSQSRDLRTTIANYATAPNSKNENALRQAISNENKEWCENLTLKIEHEDAQTALANTRVTLKAYADCVYRIAQKFFPENWRDLKPSLPTIACWVGYDLDGRTDIDWSDSIALRLEEKAAYLAELAGALKGVIKAHKVEPLVQLRDHIHVSAATSNDAAELFRADLSDPDALSKAANFLTHSSESCISDVAEITSALAEAANTASDEAAADILALKAVVETVQLGGARIHLRINAAQLRTVIARDLGLVADAKDIGRRALSELAEKAANPDKRSVNFADLETEQSTARRQFMLCAQMLKHIDKGSVIRFLIAESENPAIVMAALYLAAQYGVDDMVDISPLFETPDALETAGRFMERLLEEPVYETYVRTRGYVSVQLGFSDAGRFIGQVPAAMAVERLHNLIGRAIAPIAEDVGLLIFNTHGESMGRGGYPGDLKARFDHLLTPWAKARAAQRNIHIHHEVSFQGGDGFLHFGTPDLSRSTFAAFVDHAVSPADEETLKDPFYLRTDLVWDFYRSLRAWHERLFNHPQYASLFSTFSTGLVVRAGSRQTRRTANGGPRTLRAISHNAILQQLATPCNTAGGIGSSLRRETDNLADLINTSPRMRSLIALAVRARAGSSAPVLRAYAAAYNPSLWVSFSRVSERPKLLTYKKIYRQLNRTETFSEIMNVANKLSIDLGDFDELLARVEGAPTQGERHESRLDLHVLHAIRVAIMMRAFSLANELPELSSRHDIGTAGVVECVTSLRLDEAVDALCAGFPKSNNISELYASLEEAGHGGSAASETGYDDLHTTIIEPIAQIRQLLHTLSLAVSQNYDAMG